MSTVYASSCQLSRQFILASELNARWTYLDVFMFGFSSLRQLPLSYDLTALEASIDQYAETEQRI